MLETGRLEEYELNILSNFRGTGTTLGGVEGSLELEWMPVVPASLQYLKIGTIGSQLASATARTVL